MPHFIVQSGRHRETASFEWLAGNADEAKSLVRLEPRYAVADAPNSCAPCQYHFDIGILLALQRQTWAFELVNAKRVTENIREAIQTPRAAKVAGVAAGS